MKCQNLNFQSSEKKKFRLVQFPIAMFADSYGLSACKCSRQGLENPQLSRQACPWPSWMGSGYKDWEHTGLEGSALAGTRHCSAPAGKWNSAGSPFFPRPIVWSLSVFWGFVLFFSWGNSKIITKWLRHKWMLPLNSSSAHTSSEMPKKQCASNQGQQERKKSQFTYTALSMPPQQSTPWIKTHKRITER